MADDIIQRSYRLSDRPARAPAAGGNDPLAELARLIGQNDPFGEYGRDQARAAPMPAAPAFRAAEPAAEDWNSLPPPAAPPRHMAPAYAEPPHYPEDERYPATVPGYEQGAEAPDHPHFADAQQEQYYQDAPPRRRWGILVMGLVFVLAVLGTAGAFGYRALYGVPGSSPPKVIAADPTPSKLTPPKKDLSKVAAAPSAAAEKLAPPPEPPVELKAKPPSPIVQGQIELPAGEVLPAAPAAVANGSAPPPAPAAVAQATLGSEPKKVHTIAIRPDMTVAQATPPAAAPPAPPAARPAPPAAPAVRPAPVAPLASAPPAAPTRLAAAPSNGAPLSLSPDAQPAAPTRPAPATRVTSVAPTAHVAPAAATGGFAVQVSSRRSEAEAQAAIRSLQAKFPAQLGGHAPLIRKVELGEKGTYYRAMIGPFGSSEEAGKLCAALKAAGGSCFVQKI
jgi:hypothetical protein